MKEIRAVIRPQKLPRLREVLRAIPGFPGMTISKVAGCGATSRHTPNTIREVLTDFTDKVRIEIIAPDDMTDTLVDQIVEDGDRLRGGPFNAPVQLILIGIFRQPHAC